MMRAFYTLFLYLALPVIALRLLWRARLAPAYRRRWGERFALTGELPAGPVIWVHAVSVGETLAALDMIRALQTRYPDHRVLVTTTTPTGSERVQSALGTTVSHVYLPYDLPDCWWRFFSRVQPALLIVMETELWPNLLAACAARQVPVLLANARLSARSAAGYERLGGLTRPMVARLSKVAAQQAPDAERFRALGVAPEKITITGSIKFDLTLTEAQRRAAAVLRQDWAPRDEILWLAASTHQGEDEIILAAFAKARTQCPALRLILVPRHPERFDRVTALCEAAGWHTQRRSRRTEASFDVLVGDTMGELLIFFGAAHLCFVGGSLVPTGGHNMIEPAAWARPVLCGPHLFNFAEVSRLMIDAGGLQTVSDADAMAEAVVALAGSEAHRARMGLAAQAVAEANRGALARLLAEIDQLV
ncbi:lipid IV(A) 3-deoxy-D-manno-octulosonic acid transferase [Simiduia sp. 21SJ11W-1]|uniref:lipid IV(A) 3-deoxy-D-manno-octulosonic acid transferase n=1 Tax=Simiduia sp. 21SJ11W-1 TaxID=2909669 RepID=UPI00209D1C54|nr:lipid IV(A) 3-deoxy-D-manno-octulosonic acid transferase [Simiduia sp. 21SJ11W-1]UTA49694.1 lipid IV(A) 3-deoxy-D-manno-octulosonic acid transferase [Simiduia sp. 21SJ11W-1]